MMIRSCTILFEAVKPIVIRIFRNNLYSVQRVFTARSEPKYKLCAFLCLLTQ